MYINHSKRFKYIMVYEAVKAMSEIHKLSNPKTVKKTMNMPYSCTIISTWLRALTRAEILKSTVSQKRLSKGVWSFYRTHDQSDYLFDKFIENII